MEDDSLQFIEEAYVEIPQIEEPETVDAIDVWDPGPIVIDTEEGDSVGPNVIDAVITIGGSVQHEIVVEEEVTPDYEFIFG
ncbi:MAG: hypothetical protein AAGH68_03460 [Pseudomonadota bacterium]